MFNPITVSSPSRRPWPFLAWTLLVLAPAFGRAADFPLSLAITTNRTVVTMGDNVQIQAVWKNTSEDEVPTGFTDDPRYDLRIEVITERGVGAPESKAAQRRKDNPLLFRGPSHYRTDNMSPGQEQRESFDMEDFFDLSAPGVYSIQVFGSGTASLPRSNVLTVKVEAPPLPDHVANTALMLSLAEAAHPKSADSKLVSLTIDADQSAVSAGKHLTVFYEFTNRSNHTIHFPPGAAPPEFAVDARDEKGDLAPDKEPQKALRGRMSRGEEGDPELAKAKGPAGTDLKPGGIMTGAIDAARLVDLTVPGTFTIQIWRKLPKDTGGEIHSNVLLIKVNSAALAPAQQ